MSASPKLLIIEARFYDELADALAEGAIQAIEAAGATYDRISVPGVLEIPAALSMVLTAMESGGDLYDGFVVLGCVIRGETTHYDIVSNESARILMDLIVDADLALGNGILTVENGDQAWARAKVDDMNKGGAAAEAALAMIALREKLGV
ncbi:MAG: 6,7-dimethyl-8-ribityllumazine synthase [Rhodobacteraceae bacterium]|nr:6,7-dimethyl-8-ribityllumazine synthase [Paracoccaceae bacterium]